MPELSVAQEEHKPANRLRRAKAYVVDHAPEMLMAAATTVGAVATIATYRLIQAWTDDETRFREEQKDNITLAVLNDLPYRHFPGVGVLFYPRDNPELEDTTASNEN